MAEFKEVMKQAARMCRAHEECEECPVNMIADMVPSGCLFGSGIDAEYIEEKIMDWAAEHPELRYPSWHEAWKQLFPDGQGSPCPTDYGMKYEPEWCGSNDCKKCKGRPIPADIAEKLGIKPIGGKTDENA